MTGGDLRVVARLAADHPGQAGTVILVDGGLRVPLPEGADPDATLSTVLGPALARLKRTFPSRDAYVEFWRAHPAFSRPGAWTGHVAAYVDYDLEGEAPDLRSRVREGPVWADGREMLTEPAVHSAALGVTGPVHLLRAPRDLVDQSRPLIPDHVVAEYAARLPNLTHEMVPDTNHYLITLGDREAALVAGRVREAARAG